MEQNETKKQKRKPLAYVNVHRSKQGYKGKYQRGVADALNEYMQKIGKKEGEELTNSEWKTFFKTVLIPLDMDSERRMIELFKDNRDELNELLVLHNTKASDNIAEVFFKQYVQERPNQWHDLEDFKQMALEGLVIAAQKFNPDKFKNKFITYATWWLRNRVLKPKGEKGVKCFHVSLDKPIGKPDSDGNPSTMEDIITTDMITPSARTMMYDENHTNPAEMIEAKKANDEYDFCNMLRKIKGKNIFSLDADKVKGMVGYLLGIVADNEDSEKNKQILIYMFSKIFKKSLVLYPENGAEYKQLNGYINESAKSKKELMSRLDITETQYDEACSDLMKRSYDGI